MISLRVFPPAHSLVHDLYGDRTRARWCAMRPHRHMASAGTVPYNSSDTFRNRREPGENA